MARSTKPVGRINFVLRTLVITGTAFALEFLGEVFLHLTQLAHYAFAFQRIIVFGIVGSFLLAVIDGRLIDSGLFRWFKYPVFALWILSVSIPTIWPAESRIGLALFVLLLVAGCSIPGKSAPAKYNSMGGVAQSEETPAVPSEKYRGRWFVSPVGFLRSLLTIACFWLPLIWLENVSSNDFRVWIARFGYLILSIVWFITILGRLDDAGRLLRKRYVYLATGFVLSVMLRRHLEGSSQSSHWYRLHFLGALSMLLPWLKLINGYEKLALFLLIQIPLAFLPTKPKLPDLLVELNRRKEDRKKRVPIAKTNELALCGPFEYLRILLIIAFIWIPLIYMDATSGGSLGLGKFLAYLGYFILGFVWITFANGRFEDAGWTRSNTTAQFSLVASVVSLMPLAFHWVNGYGALAIFVLIQVPIVFLKSKPIPEEPLPESGGCYRSKMSENPEGEVSHTPPKVGEAYPQQKAPIFTGISSGRDKRASRWKPY